MFNLIKDEGKLWRISKLLNIQKGGSTPWIVFLQAKTSEGLLGINQDFNNLWVYADDAAQPLQVKIIPQFSPLQPKTAVKTNYKPIDIENIIVYNFFF